MDYIFPEIVTKMLKAPSERTQMESSLVGLTVMMLGSLGLISYLIINGIITGFWYIALAITSELGVLSFQFGLLSQTYQVYNQYKMTNGMYPKEYITKMKIEEAKLLRDELHTLIKSQEVK